MNKNDEFYLDVATALAANLFDGSNDPEGLPLILDEGDKKYLIPSVFEEYLRGIQAHLWAPAFRRANDIANEYKCALKGCKSPVEDFSIDDIFDYIFQAMKSLADEYIPEQADSIILPIREETPDKEEELLNKFLESLSKNDRPKIIKYYSGSDVCSLFRCLVGGGFLTYDWQPKILKNVTSAYIAKCIGKDLLGIHSWCNTFGVFWGYPNPRFSQDINGDRLKNFLSTDEAKAINQALVSGTTNIPAFENTSFIKELRQKPYIKKS